MTQPTFIIGIDFGTTNCTMAYCSIENPNEIKQFPISQVTSPHVQEELFSLPSFLYFPLEEEKKANAMALSWSAKHLHTIGQFAKDRGGELPSRLVASAKSWLCHSGINRQDALLPLESDDSTIKISPLKACVDIFSHLKEAWNYTQKNDSFDQQIILITVPASFDPSARQLVQKAAKQANYPEIVLLEEPQAAFYAWLNTHANTWRQQLKVEDTILVIDIGGGTTDFSLIKVENEQGNLTLNRLAVGSHLLLGGDNIDLGLAYLVKQKLEDQGHIIDHWQFQSLIYQCRRAKEELLSDDPVEKIDITILGRGSRLIGQTLKTELTHQEIQEFVVNGFMPLIQPNEFSIYERRTGIQQIGLPYVQDPRISAQLAKFLSMTGELEEKKMDQFTLPTHVLFNGGTLKAPALRHQLITLLNNWAKILNKPKVKELSDANYDYAVSQGAAYYGLARQGQTIRIRSGTSRSYFIGVEEAAPAVPGISPPMQAVCIVPFGLEEGEEKELTNQEFALVIGELATFRFFSHATSKLANGIEPIVGTIVRSWKQELSELLPIETQLDKTDEEGKVIHVKLKAKVTELGILELWCVAANGKQWKLEFDTRKN